MLDRVSDQVQVEQQAVEIINRKRKAAHEALGNEERAFDFLSRTKKLQQLEATIEQLKQRIGDTRP